MKQVEAWQQAMGVGQGLGLQVEEPTSWPPHWLACATSVQAPVAASQHAPGCGQGLGAEQLASAGWKVLPAAHPGWAMSVHPPVLGLQHAPGCGQGEGEQVLLAPCHLRVLMPVQLVCERITQYVPSMLLQHAPAGAQGSVSQTEPEPMNVCPEPEVQVLGTPMVHEPLEFVQHAPGCGQALGEHEP
jgi:hypothetical protein